VIGELHIKAAEDSYRLSAMQQGMLFHALYDRQPGMDIQQVLCALPEPLDADALERSWQRVADRHPVLRTCFRWEGLAEPLQEVQSQVRLTLKTEDWRGVASQEQDNRLEAYLAADRRRGFDLASAPLMRMALFRRGDADYQFVWTTHHLLLDARSFAVLLNEVFAGYEALTEGRDLELRPPRPYRDYIDWLHKQDLSKAEEFWRQTLKGFTAPTPLTVARSGDQGPDNGEIRGEQEIKLSEAATAALRSLAQANNFTLNTVVQGAWALLLSRYSGEEDVVFGAIRACRRSTIEGAESIAGLFINTVPLRVRVAPRMQVLPWLQTLREQWVALRDYEHTPLVKIQGWSDVPRSRPLFESIFNFQDPSWDAALRAQGGKWAKRGFEIRSQSNYPLAVDAYGGPALVIKIPYHRSRFDDTTITRMLGHIKTLLEAMAENPRQPLCSLPLLTEAERQRLLVDWNDTAVDLPGQKCVHQLFEEQVERAPHALAVADEKKQLTYGELNEAANQIAQQLQILGVGPDVLTGVCLERSVDMVAALLGILKAGGAYVPLDPSYPAERLAFMCEDAQMPVLLTQRSLRARLKFQIPKLKLLCLDAPPHAWRTNPQSAIRNPQSRDLAYVIYTSGSTGTPKGVEIEHASLVNLITWHQRTHSVRSADRATLLAAPAFDASVWELWPYLTAGASVHIPDEETRLSPKKLLAWLAAKRITLSFIPTPLAEALLDEPWPVRSTLGALLTGGDKLHRHPGENLPCPLVNHYGPTENTVVTTWTVVPPAVAATPAPPIGRPIANTQLYVLDRHLQPLPIGVPGELHIAGVGLARGYHHRPRLTAEKFIPNPFSKDPRARLYKTGDWVRYLPDGHIEFLGRMDHQVKVRGNRIELGEIENALVQHPTVRDAVVVARESAPGENCLVVYLVPPSGQTLAPHVLREFLKHKLPDYMVPSAFVVLEALPLSPNGKVDRSALPAPKLEEALEKTFVAPRTPVEQSLAGIWSAVLGLRQVGIHDNFFELGGHSLLATQVISRVCGVFQLDFPLHNLFESPTVAGLAARIEQARQAAQGSGVPALTPVAFKGDQPLSFAQERLWFLEQLEPGKAFNNIPLALRLQGALDVPGLERSLSALVDRHKTLRTTFGSANGRPLAVIAPAGQFTVPVADLSRLPLVEREAAARRLMTEEARQPFDLTESPLLRVKLLRLAEQEHMLLLTTHHIASDGWSMGIFYGELTALYQAYIREDPSPLPELPIEYADFAHWQRQWLQGKVLEKQLAYWKQRLGGKLLTLDLPTDRPRPPLQTYRGATKCFTLPAKLSAELKKLSRKEDVTLFMLLMGAFQAWLHRYSGQDDVFVGSPIAGRTRVETESVMGLFLNTLVFHGDLSGDPTFSQFLKRIRQVALEAYAHQDLPFERLVDTLQPERDLSRSPLFQVMFVLQNEPLPPLELAGLKLTPVHVHSGTAKFDLMLSMEEGSDGLSGFVEYNADLFDAATVARMLAHFQTLLEGIVAHPEERLSQLPLLTEAERHQVLVEWNDTRADYPKDKCVHQLFEEQAERTPDRVAMIFEDEQMTYRQLDQAANQLAQQLRELGVGPGVLAGLCLERSTRLLVGLLGILKAGGAYVPLDPAYPRERLAFMLEDSQASLLLTQESLRDQFTFQIPKLKLLCLDAPPQAWRTNPQSAIRNPQSRDLAYVIYTSGSTGKPKGVQVPHRAVVNFLNSMRGRPGLNREQVLLAVTTLSFDIAGLELFLPLTVGARVVMASRDEAADGARLAAKITNSGVTVMQATPTTWQLLLEAGWPGNPQLKILCGGEALPRELANQLLERGGELWNLYGPTETTIWSAAGRAELGDGPVSIGRPIANTQMYILDRHRQPVAVGVPGELFIGGDGLAHGYLNRPELTREKFVSHPFSDERDARLYRTGDLARWWPDGRIECLGRLDHQVKLRGFRIELGEIEAALSKQPAVRQCVAAVRGQASKDKRLVAYVVPVPDKTPTTAELRRWSQEKLPDYMVPSVFVFLKTFPLTPNGKVDRKALPEPDSVRPDLETPYVPPRSDLEETTAAIWRELLRVERVGLYDNFFDLGGHSLLAVQVQARLREALNLDLPIIKLFQYPTINSLTQFLSRGEEPVLPRFHDRGRRQRAAFAQRRQPAKELAR
jgi:amino acid adenylation domain-containing protein